MAVLHLLLQHNPAVRSIAELAKVCAKHAWVENKKFLLVPYHMIGARNMESAILGGYVDHVMELHPTAPLPGVYLADEIFKNAEQHRQAAGRREVLRATEPGPDQATGRHRPMGQARQGLGCRPVRGAPSKAPARQRRTQPTGRRPGAVHLPGLHGDRPGQGRSLRRSRRGPVDHQRPRQVARLRRADPVPRRTDPLAGDPLGGSGLRADRGEQAGQAGRVPQVRTPGADHQLRGPAA